MYGGDESACYRQQLFRPDRPATSCGISFRAFRRRDRPPLLARMSDEMIDRTDIPKGGGKGGTMLARLLAHLRQQWMGALALFLVLTSGVAYAANTVFSSDIVDNQVFSADVRNDTLAGGGLTATDLRANSVGNSEVQANQITSGDVRDDTLSNGGLTGSDVRNQSGVDTCVKTIRIGQLCFRVENFHRGWNEALQHCANLDLRLPSLGEALELVTTHGIPNVDESEYFWTGDRYWGGSNFVAEVVNDGGTFGPVTIIGST